MRVCELSCFVKVISIRHCVRDIILFVNDAYVNMSSIGIVQFERACVCIFSKKCRILCVFVSCLVLFFF